jgi:hypothetical protein
MTIDVNTAYSIGEVAHIVHRRPATVRAWDRTGALPEDLRPVRGDNGRRYWTAEQVQGIKEWIKETKRYPGKGLPGYDPDSEKAEAHIDKIREGKVTHATEGNDGS